MGDDAHAVSRREHYSEFRFSPPPPAPFTTATAASTASVESGANSSSTRGESKLHTWRKTGTIIVTNIRQEDDFIIEWLNYHLWIGFDHILIFCQDDSPDSMNELLKPYVDAGAVTVQPWEVGGQKTALLNFLDQEQAANQTVFFTDADEFLVLCEHALVGDFMKDSRHAGSTCLYFPWLRFGTSFLPMHPKGSPVLTHYFLRHPLTQMPRLGKIAIRSPLYPAKRMMVHHVCGNYAESRNAHVPFSMARLHHYWVRGGMGAFERRVKRGSEGNFDGQTMYAKMDVRESNNNNRVADSTLLSILEEFPGLMTPRPPSERRKVLPNGYCKDGIMPWTEQQEKAIFMPEQAPRCPK